MVVYRQAFSAMDRYGLIGDMSSAALVGTDGSIDWCCLPRFDSASVFAAILGRNGGSFRIAPVHAGATSRQSYLPDTNVLCTRFQTPTGEMSVTDFMPVGKIGASTRDAPHEIHRIVRCESGSVEVLCSFQPRLDYARADTGLVPFKNGVLARGGGHSVTLTTDFALEVTRGEAVARFSLTAGQEAVFVMAYGYGRPRRVASYRSRQQLDLTKAYWKSVAGQVTYRGLWREQVIRSFLVLQLMRYRRTGAIIAAPTTSLPEEIGGTRNWDYRYAWLRDSSFTVDVFHRMGDSDAGVRYVNWLLERCKANNGHTRIVYGVAGNSSLKEVTLDHLEGYGGSRPIRVGNRASRHLQLDVFGEVILTVYSLHRLQGWISDEAWSLVANFADVVTRNWRRKDRGMWEVRGKQQHFVYSKVMCWAAMDRAARIAGARGDNDLATAWRYTADEIRAEVLERGWSDRKQSFVQRYGSDALDASVLVIPFLYFLPPGDPRVRLTLEAISRELADGPFVWRYLPQETDDGLEGQDEGAFTMLSFWLIGNLICTGQVELAVEYFERMLGNANHLGLFSEMINPRTGQFLGNFPQAYSHVGLIHTAQNLSRALRGIPADEDEPVLAAD